MSIALADRVKETTITTGTGTVDLDGPETGFQGFVAAVGGGAEVYYVIVGQAGGGAEGEWEVGIGTVTDAAPDTLSRDTVLSSSNAGALVTFSAGTKDVFLTRPATLGALLHVRDEKADGTAGGGNTAGVWNTRDLNTVVVNQITGASLAANQVTLPAGTYRIRARAPGHDVGNQKLRWRNVTDVATTVVGGSTGAAGLGVAVDSAVWGRFAIAASKTFELQHFTQNAQASDGFGLALGADGEVEVYAEVWIAVAS